MKVELIACSRPLPGQCGTANNPMGVTPSPMRVIEQAASVCYDSKPDFEDFAIGCYLLAGAEMIKFLTQ